MKKVRLFNHYNNGANSKVNVYFEDGTEWHRTVDASDIQKLAKEGEKYLPQLMKKYKEPQKKQEWVTARINPYTGIRMDNPFTWQHFKYCLLLIIIYILISKIIELWQ